MISRFLLTDLIFLTDELKSSASAIRGYHTYAQVAKRLSTTDFPSKLRFNLDPAFQNRNEQRESEACVAMRKSPDSSS